MHISTHNVDDLNMKVVINLGPADYQPLVERKIKDYARTARVPGFRPGKVPSGMIKKLYGTSVLIDEVNNLLSRKVYEFIQEEKIDILGSPLPSDSSRPQADWENPKEMEFTYDLGLAPKLDVRIDSGTSFTYFVVSPTDEDIDRALENIARRNGTMAESETIGDDNLVLVKWVELDADGHVREGGVLHSSSISIDTIADASLKARLIGLKVGDTLDADVNGFTDNEADRAAMLGVSRDALPSTGPMFRVTVEKVQHLVPAELTEELLGKMYPDGSVKTLDDLKEKVREDYRSYFMGESDRKLKNDVVVHLLQTLNPALPDAFLKRWLVRTNEEKATAEQIEQEYDGYANGLRWQLIENVIIRDHGISVSADELKDGIRAHIRRQFAAYGIPNFGGEHLEEMVSSFMKREDELRKVNEQLYDMKVLELFKEKFTLVEEPVSSEDFYKRLTGQ